MLLGIPGDNTFSNYQEANRTFWRQTVLPLVQRTTDALSEWLTASYGPTFSLKADTDDIPALASERDALWTRIDAATY
jgi:phage portal protein BeeE